MVTDHRDVTVWVIMRTVYDGDHYSTYPITVHLTEENAVAEVVRLNREHAWGSHTIEEANLR